MSPCVLQRFEQFNQMCIQRLREKIQAEGAHDGSLPSGQTQGVVSRAGFEVSWIYEVETETLTIQCTSSPFLVPCAVINAQIKTWIGSCYPVAN